MGTKKVLKRGEIDQYKHKKPEVFKAKPARKPLFALILL
ncbi:MAG: hypothetical protein FMNOHCHN_01786 [Ignavibacteriaceae bacterium]|nr:hypothetical protein [Ignavibacteriaceae bacterium]